MFLRASRKDKNRSRMWQTRQMYTSHSRSHVMLSRWECKPGIMYAATFKLSFNILFFKQLTFCKPFKNQRNYIHLMAKSYLHTIMCLQYLPPDVSYFAFNAGLLIPRCIFFLFLFLFTLFYLATFFIFVINTSELIGVLNFFPDNLFRTFFLVAWPYIQQSFNPPLVAALKYWS